MRLNIQSQASCRFTIAVFYNNTIHKHQLQCPPSHNELCSNAQSYPNICFWTRARFTVTEDRSKEQNDQSASIYVHTKEGENCWNAKGVWLVKVEDSGTLIITSVRELAL
ncbi:uncharacterized protein BDZ99DRAFT_460560 [Mytilinidion resinicola]|uniref:Uncharacterized protein n=1 Tax=Mytilinidion resinicola TaxID=574789 RepID=A0A6A6YZ62_9PEZI|nr:uncharacterized protein BDZ99DRAFT_460560 [Mytilinidion resinicola]KAF2813294.1 hypothetical protein BDZ99DRAFT_460560 [Mytilinidion resinicola]